MYQLFDKVTFVTQKPNEYNEYIPNAFVFDSENKKQEKTALAHAGHLFDKKFSIKMKVLRLHYINHLVIQVVFPLGNVYLLFQIQNQKKIILLKFQIMNYS